ncbi:Sec63 Brl domain-containing protein [Melampsora americana]|nr:Sec63 Brl domain-containing protein [Melampsora americana]
MAASYEYDESGQSGFFVFTFLLLILIPWTISTLQTVRTKVAKPPCVGWNLKDDQVRKARSKAPGINLNHVSLALGWALLAYVGYCASFVKASAGTYDPFSILGISTGLSDKQIKRHYKRLSLKFHPDKLKLTGNQTMEEVNAHFVNITKAYKSLTDETIRKNYETYGHPDGKQDSSMGIALPKWIVESQNNVYVIGIYGLVFGLLLPWFVGKWWHGSRKFTKDQVRNESAALYFTNLTEDTQFSHAIEVLSASEELKLLHQRNAKLYESKDFQRLEDQVKTALFNLTGEKLDGKLYNNGEKYVRRTAILLYAHMLRIPITDTALLKVKHTAVNYARHLTMGMQSIVLGYNWLSTFLVITTIQQRLIQAVHPALSPLLQLPYVSTKLAEKLAKENSITSPEQYFVLSEEEKRKLFPDIQGVEQKRLAAISERWPKLELISSEFKVVGEKIVTPGCVIQFTIKVRISPPKAALNQPDEKKAEEPTEQDLKGEEMEIDELLGRKKAGADGEEPSPLAHAPHYTKASPAPPFDIDSPFAYTIRSLLFVQPIKFSDVGYTKVRTLRTSFQAPQGPGLYTFQAYIKSDSYIGTDVQASMQLRVEPPEALENDGNANAEDDISEPDEDTLAGQMAAMRGQPTKKKQDDSDSDDTSGTESSEDSSSDSDSDSD